MKKQSAFSLIEVLVALLILSIAVIGIEKILLESIKLYRKAEIRDLATTIAWSIVNDLSINQEGVGMGGVQEYWQEKLNTVVKGSLLTIQQERAVPCIYIITIEFKLQTIQPLVLRLAV